MYKPYKVTIMSREDLERRNTRNLLHILGCARAVVSAYSNYAGPRCCEVCREFVGDEEDWKQEVEEPRQPYIEYVEVLKDILAERDHVRRR